MLVDLLPRIAMPKLIDIRDRLRRVANMSAPGSVSEGLMHAGTIRCNNEIQKRMTGGYAA